MTDWLDILATPISVHLATRFLSDPAAGGVDLFLGTTRADRRPDGVELVALDYEAYDAMARRQLADLAAAARGRWPVVKLVVLHRVGRVPLGDASVLVGCSCPHRGEAFEATRFLIDELKRSAAIWKREVWADGAAGWVHPEASGERRQASGNSG